MLFDLSKLFTSTYSNVLLSDCLFRFVKLRTYSRFYLIVKQGDLLLKCDILGVKFYQLPKDLVGLFESLSCNQAIGKLNICFRCIWDQLQGYVCVLNSIFIFHQTLFDASSFYQQLVVEPVVVSNHPRHKLLRLLKLTITEECLQVAHLKIESYFVLHIKS